MYQCVSLNKKNFEIFKNLNEARNKFNLLNKDFFELYNRSNFAEQLILKRKVKLLKKSSEYIGYIWYNINVKNSCSINSLSVFPNCNYLPYKFLIDSLKKNYTNFYLCEHNDYNFEILKNIGFNKKEGTLILYSDSYHNIPLTLKDGLEFENFRIGIDEKKRCDLQNEIFKNNTRIPLELDDIYFDEMQSYYFKFGAVFLKKDGKYIGYGQIIVENSMPFIVNFGILKEYRGKGYGKSLITYLFKICNYNNFKEVQIKVKSSNTIALNLYKSLDFKVISQRYNWELKK